MTSAFRRRAAMGRIGIAVCTSIFVWAWTGAGADPDLPEAQAPAAPAPTLWLTPPNGSPGAASDFARAIDDLQNDRAQAAAKVFQAKLSDPRLGGYAALYLSRAQLALERHDAAASTIKKLIAAEPTGYLEESAYWTAVDAADAAGRHDEIVRLLQALIASKPIRYEQAYLRLGRAAAASGNRDLALESFRRLYYEFALAPEAKDALKEITALGERPSAPSAGQFKLDLGRAERFFAARRYAEAREVFAQIRSTSVGDDRSLIDLRLAQCDYHIGKHAAARTALRAYIDESTFRLPEAQKYYLDTSRATGRHDEYLALARAFVDGNAGTTLAEQVLDQLGTYHILQNDDAKAAEVFAELYQKFPKGAFGDRAAWKAGWWAYKNGAYAEAIRFFESAVESYPRADYKPSWLYWAARAHEQLGRKDAALEGFNRVVELYRNSYYGRQAALEIGRMTAATRPSAARVSPASRQLPPTVIGGELPPNADLIRALLAQGLYDDAIAEIRRLQRDRGTSPLLEATVAFAFNQQGQLRPAINTMRRAYPQFMSAGGEALPEPMLRIIFPIQYWDLIVRHANAKDLDPFLMAALIAQESTFQADVRSSANAYGLMQVIPSTGRRYAPAVGVKRFRTSVLTDPETNIRIGMTYFSELMREFGDPAAALAAYNAGENRVSRWLAERPGIDRDEFVDDIPFPETQNYVKRILGTADDYRLLYAHLVRR
ncbi:MAG TPA: transglycosylase SLT domain-containing protein [Vicinamibacterales bacterium]|nr:transglycosylase SLT domain-containing protein [Vicinamibacterales bacterium]